MTPRATGAQRRHIGWAASVPVRTTAAAVIVVTFALAAGAFGLVALLRASLEEGVESSARLEVATVAALVSRGGLTSVLPAGRDDLLAEVVTARGRILATSANVADPSPLVAFPAVGFPRATTVGALRVEELDLGVARRADAADGPYVVVATRVVPSTASRLVAAGTPVAVEVAVSLGASWLVVARVEIALLGGVPVLVAVVGVLVLLLTRRALSTVEQIRAEVAEITLTDLHRRVSEPVAHDAIGRLALTMNAMLDRLESSSARQRRFVGDASHEMRTPLATIEATLEIALAHPNQERWQESAEEALAGARRLARIVEELLLLARADEGRLVSATFAPVDLDEIVLSEARFARLPERVELRLDGVSAGRVLGDADQLGRVVRNLLDNAVRHALRVVSVAVTTEHGVVRLVVADDGLGIAPADRERVFERFTRLDDVRDRDSGGSGLGLALVREIIAAHGGTVHVAESTIGARLVVDLASVDASAADGFAVGTPDDDP